MAPLFFPSSKLCSRCGWLASELPLKQRVFRCDRCGLEIDRDLNAAKNLLALAAGPADSNACGEDVTPYLAAVLVEAGTVKDDGGRSSWKMTYPALAEHATALPMSGRRGRTAISRVTAA